MPPAKVETPVTEMPELAAEIVPELLMPPAKLETPETEMPLRSRRDRARIADAAGEGRDAGDVNAGVGPDEIVPELLMPPAKLDTPVT